MTAPSTTPGDFLRRVSKIRPWKSRDQRAPHKPLLLALGRCSRGEERLVSFVEVERHFRELWRRFVPPRSGRAYYPFGRLARGDGLWDIPKRSILRSWQKEDLSPVELRDHDIEGDFPEEVFDLLKSDPGLALETAQLILHGHFPRSLHDEILEAVGFASDSTAQDFPTLVREPAKRRRMIVFRRPRSLRFRREVVRAYDERCAICEFDLRMNDELLGLEAAHIQWHSHKGPDVVSNGLALCLLHHRALDRGALGLKAKGDGFRVLVSSQVRWKSSAAGQLLDFSGRLIRPSARQARQASPRPRPLAHEAGVSQLRVSASRRLNGF